MIIVIKLVDTVIVKMDFMGIDVTNNVLLIVNHVINTMATVWNVKMVTMVMSVINNVVLVVILQYVINLMVSVTAVRMDIMVIIVTEHVPPIVRMKYVIEMVLVHVNLDTLVKTAEKVRVSTYIDIEC